MEDECLPPLSRLAVCGGTHGNECSGVYIIRELQKVRAEETDGVSVVTVLSNPRAVGACTRYIDTDLNRCFTEDILRSTVITDSYEVTRARELDAQLGPRGSQQAVDVICDLHNTTSNMGLCILFNSLDWLSLHIYKYLQSKITSVPVRAIQIELPPSKAFSLDSLGKHGFSIEMGPQPNGVLRADIYNTMRRAVDLTIEWLQQFNSGSTFQGGEVEVYTGSQKIDYPRDPVTREITATIHPQLQDNDFKLLRPGDPIFLTFAGETVRHQGEELYPFFINECAYYEKNTAFFLAPKITRTIPSVRVKTD